jgi:hypothetical protein
LACCRTAGARGLQSARFAVSQPARRAALQDYTLAIEHEYPTE